MGLFSWLKKVFKRTIAIGDVDDSHLLALVKDNAKIKFGKTLEVKPNFLAVIVYKNKVMDTFVEGSYRLDVPTLPILSRYQKLTKPNKKGDLPKTFKADIYFVNLKVFQNQKFGDCLVHIKDKSYKGVNIELKGVFDYQISSPVDFLEAMFTQYGVLNNGIAKNELSCWVADLVAKKVQKNKPSVELLYKNDPVCFDGLIEYLNKNISDCGVKLLNLEVAKIKFPKRIYKKISITQDKLAPQKVEQYVGEMQITNNPVKSAQEASFANDMNEVYKTEAQKIEQDMSSKYYVSSSDGASVLDGQKQTEIANVDSETISNNNVLSDVGFDDGEIVAKQNDAFEMEKPIQKTLEYKKCNHCGALNSKDSQICFACKNKI